MTVYEFEQKVFELEGVRIVIRATGAAKLGSYDYVKSYPQSNTVMSWLKTRVFGKTGNLDVVVIDGAGALPNRKMHMATLRDGYAVS